MQNSIEYNKRDVQTGLKKKFQAIVFLYNIFYPLYDIQLLFQSLAGAALRPTLATGQGRRTTTTTQTKTA